MRFDLIIANEIDKVADSINRSVDTEWKKAAHQLTTKNTAQITHLRTALAEETLAHKSTTKAYNNDFSRYFNEVSMKDKKIRDLRKTIAHLDAERARNIQKIKSTLDQADIASKEIAIWKENYELASYISMHHEETIDNLNRQLEASGASANHTHFETTETLEEEHEKLQLKLSSICEELLSTQATLENSIKTFLSTSAEQDDKIAELNTTIEQLKVQKNAVQKSLSKEMNAASRWKAKAQSLAQEHEKQTTKIEILISDLDDSLALCEEKIAANAAL